MDKKELRLHQKDAEATLRFLTFSLGGELYALPLLKVREVIGYCEITPVPFSLPHFKGIINLRGQIISIVDLRHKFRFPKSEITAESSIIILDIPGFSLGAIVDYVESVLVTNHSEIAGPPEVQSGVKTEFMSGVTRKNDRLIVILDVEKSLSTEETNLIKQQTSAA